MVRPPFRSRCSRNLTGSSGAAAAIQRRRADMTSRKKIVVPLIHASAFSAWLLLLFMATSAHAAPLSLATTPLLTSTAAEPNILLTFDDSGSMAWAYLPDDVDNYQSNHRGCASNINKIFYNPSITYKPGVDANGTSLGDASFTGAWIDGYKKTAGTVDLSSN